MKEEINILITSVSAKVLLIKSFKHALIDENIKGKVIGTDISKISAGLYFCDEQIISPRLNDYDYLSFIEDLCLAKKIKLIVPTRDDDVVFFSEHKNYLEEKYPLKVLAPSLSTSHICSNKIRFYRFLTDKNIPTIKTWDHINYEISYPCVLKPNTGAGAKNFFVINNEKELKEKMNSIPGLIIQEFVEGTEFTIDYFSDFNSQCLSVVPRIRMKIVSGESKVGKTVKDKEIIELTKKLAKELNLIGHNVIQCFKTELEDIKFIEVNPRFGGGSNLSFAAGRNTPRYLIQLLLNKKPQIEEFKENLLMLRYSEDYFIQDG